MKLTAVPRITLGLVSLAVVLLMGFDMVLKLFPSDTDTTRNVRTRVANSLAIQAAALLQASDWRAVDRTLAAVQARDKDIASIGLRRADGTLAAQAGDHAQRWPVGGDALRPAPDTVSVALMAEGQRWGALEINFKPTDLGHSAGWLFSGPARLVALFALIGGAIYYLYLRRLLQYLDPSSVVPDRVRSAFDTLSEGVLILDLKGRIMLANKAFEALRPAGDQTALMGVRMAKLDWLVPAEAAADPGAGRVPWASVIKTGQAQRGLAFEAREQGAVKAHVVLSCGPLHDERGHVRGCLVTIGDVTELARSNQQLTQTLTELAASKQQLQLQNQELEMLASHDMLSGCLNRRALFERAGALFGRAHRDGLPLYCVMADIDHFKKVNDTHGHGVGDQAIKRFAALLRQHVRPDDVLGRYGGEEFCLFIPGASLERVLQVTEAMRASVAANNGQGMDAQVLVHLTSSFGVAALADGANSVTELIDLADQALYVAKQAGRNRVVTYVASPMAQGRS